MQCIASMFLGTIMGLRIIGFIGLARAQGLRGLYRV